MFSQPVCKRCGQPLRGNYLKALGATWHPEHFVCAGCGRPLDSASFMLHQNAPYHSECYANLIAPHCAYCKQPLVSEYLVDHWGTRYCKRHQHEYPACDFCARLIPPGEQEQGRNVERSRCPTCRASAIETAEEAKPVFSRLIRWASNQGLTYHNLRLGLELCGRTRLAELLRERTSTHALGATVSSMYRENGRVVRREVTGVAVLQGLPSTLFQGVTVHELGHVWLVVHGVEKLPSWAEEGFCELLSYRYYVELNTPESLYHASCIARNPDPIYGEGFRRVRDLAASTGFPQLLEILRTTKRMPSR
ncbi:MAG TPA: protein DA1 [Ktedonobacteraceae bacterium]|nr:protein DA1 [Ktedonobacteraceae bacterium]